MNYKAQFLDYINSQKRYSSHTLRSYSDDLGQFYLFLEITPEMDGTILNVTRKEVRNWVVHLMNDKLAARSVTRKISTLKSFFGYLHYSGYIKENPAKRVILPKLQKSLPVFLSGKKLDDLLDNIGFGNDFQGIRNKLIIELFYGTGIRLSELTTIRCNQVDLTGKLLKVLGKRNKERIIPLTPTLCLAIDNFLQARDQSGFAMEGPLFITEKGRGVYPRLVYRVVNKYLSLVSTQERKSPHVLRHTFATEMLNQGADLNAIKEMLGHSNLAATQVYTHASFEKLKQIYKQAHPRA